MAVLGCRNKAPQIDIQSEKIISKRLKSLRDDLINNKVSNNTVFEKVLLEGNDSLVKSFLFNISYAYLEAEDSTNFRYWNNKTFSFSRKTKDTSGMAEAQWDLANFFFDKSFLDSAFYYNHKAYNLYSSIGETYTSGKIQLNIGVIQKDIKDYIGSEITTVQAIKKLKPYNKPKTLYLAYNNLGVVNKELGNYDIALEYHKEALKYEKEIKNNILRTSSYNNIGVVKMYQGDFSQASFYFEKALKVKGIKIQNPLQYARLLDNLAFSRLNLKDTSNLKKQFYNALNIRISENHIPGIITSRLHAAEYFLFIKDTATAISNAFKAEDLSKEYKLDGELLESYLLLAKLDRTNSAKYLAKYITLSESRQMDERAVQNRFARIRFETDEFIAENDQLSLEKNWMIFGFSSLVLLLLSIFIIFNQRSKNRELRLIKDQQKSNEDIYNLLLDSQTKLEEGQEGEKKRISKELHDGILSQFFGIRLNLELLNEQSGPDAIEQRKKYVNELKLLEKDIRKVSHQLSTDFLASEKGFLNILEELLHQQEVISSFQSELRVEKNVEWEKLSPKIKINLYRIVQESLHNIHKYAGAHLVNIIFSSKKDILTLIIQDDGKGFDPESTQEGIGLKNIRSRVKDLNGKIKLRSGTEGTKFLIEIPLK